MIEENVVKRITTLEEKHVHQERILADLNEVILDQQKRITRLEALLTRADDRIERLSVAIEQPRSATDERPPHY
ncbi:SlyX family protein [Bremerella alba]|uniref:Protein SlyX n=1 Tax=Bremerella alba TaxID=980252 RepID=A0A7V8V3H9_9BACT|nr:SlyX family protein [Bremerella alba]MBA2114252.1 Protein SlyX [Bremerella alba]